LHPNVHFVVQDFAGGSEFVAKIDAALQAGQPPDILNWTDGLNSGFAHTSGVLEDLSKIAPTASAALLPAYKKLYTVNGSLFLMPTYASIYNFVKVNKAMFDAAGLTLPADGNWTYDEFNADMAKLAVPGKVWPVAIRLTDWVTTYDWQGFLWGYGCEPWNSTLTVSTINSPACLQALQWLIDANNKGWIEPGAATIDYGPEDTLFNTCAVAISYGRANAVQRQQGMAAQTTCPMDVQIEQWPHLASAPPVAPSVSTDGWSVFTQADPVKKQVIGDFIDFAFQPQYSMPYAIQQSSPSLYTSWPNPLVSNPDLLKADTWIAQQGVFNDGVLGPNYLQIRQQTAPIWQSAFLGQTSPQDALSQIDTKINILLTTPSQ
jgi:ABC-type glycerol-3-phosphate transport system substrate-binding protein